MNPVRSASASRALFLYDDDVALRCPAHYRKPMFDLLPSEHGIHTDIICFDSSCSELRVETRGAQRVVHLPKLRPTTLFSLAAEVRRSSANLSRAFRILADGAPYTHIVAFNYPLFLSAAGKWARRMNARFIIHIGYLSPEELLARASHIDRIRGWAGLWLRNRMLRRCDQIWAMSEAMKTFFVRQYQLDPARIVAWPSGVEATGSLASYRSTRDERRRALGIGEREIALVYVGSVARIREPEFMLDVMDALSRRSSEHDYRLHCFGYTPNQQEFSSFQHAIAARGFTGRVHLHAAILEAELPQVIAACDIGVSAFPPTPLFTISSPIKILEYMNAGIPTVANDIPDQKFVLHASGAGRICGWDAYEVATAIEEMSRLSHTEREALGEKGHAWFLANREVRVLARMAASWLGNG